MRSFSLIFKQFSRSVLLVACFTFLGAQAHAQGDAAKGEALFKSKCTACHKVESEVVGPALGALVTEETDDKYLIKWIQNNQALIAAKNPKAVAIFNKYQQKNMTIFADLSDGDVTNILTFIRADWKAKQDEAAKKPVGAGVAEDKGPNKILVFSLLGVLVIALIIILVLNRVIATLERMMVKNQGVLLSETSDEEGVVQADKLAWLKKLAKNKKFVFFVILSGTIFLGVYTFIGLWTTNVHQGYQPVQPIKFPHDLHAGAMKIDCQYCHSGAYKSKNASIPSLNVCMNCHKTVKTESPEIHKIYDALGYDVKTAKYDSTKARPIQWIRIHNLPDLVYFNHSQHVKVGKIKCQTCHGPVETMKEVYQYSPLTMKWCIQCHKRTNVDYKDNAYYTNLEQVHKLLKDGKQPTAALMGGIECGKCHY